MVNPKERKVVVVESILAPTVFRETLAKVLFKHFEVSVLECFVIMDNARTVLMHTAGLVSTYVIVIDYRPNV